MKTIILFCFLAINSTVGFSQSSPKGNYSFDNDWRFFLGNQIGADKSDFDDNKWRKLDLPHDWSIEDLPGTNSPFNRHAISQVGGGFTSGGTAWYRRKFRVDSTEKDKVFTLLFEGVYMNAMVWVNGAFVGNHPYGYSSFKFDISKFLRFGDDNTIAVKVMNEGENSRWYSGSGIYRHVWLTAKEPVHLETWGTYITTPEVSFKSALTEIVNSISNKSSRPREIVLKNRILDQAGREAGYVESMLNILSGETKRIKQNTLIKNPDLWSVNSPTLYSLETEIFEGDKKIDHGITFFGIRTIKFSAEEGFLLNGKSLKLKGGCVHHDNGPLGAKAYDRAEERRVELLKASGYNAIRCSHNPPSPAFLDACDRLGMLVIDEAFDMWKDGKNPFDYHLYFNEWWKTDIENMIFRDRNHPSVIMWSIGNEIPNKNKPEVVEVAKMLADYVREIDPTRPVSSALNELNPDKDPYFGTLDIAGYNYAVGGDHKQESLYSVDHKRIPGRIMYGSESLPLLAFRSWMEVLDKPYLIGDFVWTSFDYIGEASIGWRGYWPDEHIYPWTLAYCGDIDICGWKRPQSFYRDALWKENQLSVFIKAPEPSFALNHLKADWSHWEWHDVVSHWNWEKMEGDSIEVNVYSSCEQVELFLNGRSMGRKSTTRENEFIAVFQVPYHEGILEAIGYTEGKAVNRAKLQTAKEVSSISLTVDRKEIKADGQDLAYVTVELLDNLGTRNPSAENQLKFELTGPGEIVGVGNANPMSTESYTLPERKAWQGRCLVIIKSDNIAGNIRLKVSSEGLKATETEIISEYQGY